MNIQKETGTARGVQISEAELEGYIDNRAVVSDIREALRV